ncbi:hypothetical protein [Corynebacterium atrinae]|uniref:hypothetical protein n=1 Tax=Corynebacterium atrinae TaxID=1336740 RepID=UPI0025B403BE|nr:hypothetical protein [Corynebacterium atrinae]
MVTSDPFPILTSTIDGHDDTSGNLQSFTGVSVNIALPPEGLEKIVLYLLRIYSLELTTLAASAHRAVKFTVLGGKSAT